MKINSTRSFRWIALFITLIMSFACNTPRGLVKTPFGGSERQDYQTLGISVVIPNESENRYARYMINLYDSEFYQKNCDCKAALSMGMHPFWFGSEPHYILQVIFRRLSPAAFNKFKVSKHLTANSDLCFVDYKPIISTKVDIINFKEPDSTTEFVLFRKFIILSDGDAVIIGARLERIFEQNQDEAADIKAVVKLFDSVKPL